MPDIITPYCTLAWADTFFDKYVFDANWRDASSEKKVSALCAATDFIDLYCTFFDEGGNPFLYEQTPTEDFADDITPRRLKQACAQEAAYLLSLDDNPAEPHPLTVLGLLRGDFGTVDPSLVPPIFSKQVVTLLRSLGGDVDASATGGNNVAFFERHMTS